MTVKEGVFMICLVHTLFLQTTVVRKKMYYNMRVKTLRRNMSALLNRLADNKEQLMKGASDRYKALAFTIKEVRKAGYTSKTILPFSISL